MNQIAQYKAANKAIVKFHKESLANRKEKGKKIRAIKGRLDSEIDAVVRAYGRLDELCRDQIKEHEAVIKIVRGIYDMIDVLRDIEQNPISLEPKVYYSSYRHKDGKKYVEPLEFIYDNDYGKIGVYIVDRGTDNNYAIVIIGVTIFGCRACLDYSFTDMGIKYAMKNVNIQDFVREAKTEQELKDWYANNKNRLKVISRHSQELIDIEREYEEAKKLITQKQWQVAYLEHKRDYYSTSLRGSPECVRIIKELKKLKK